MTRLVWDDFISREISFGVDRGVVYPRIGTPVAWNGLVAVDELPEDSDHTIVYYDGQPYVQGMLAEGFAATVEALTYPVELDKGEEFDLSYRVTVDDGYVYHLVYNARLLPAQIDYQTSDWASPTSFKWNLHTTPEKIDRVRPSSHVILNTFDTSPAALALVEDLLYGSSGSAPRIPHLPELINIYEANAIFVVIDHGDGTWTATGPDSMVHMTDATSFVINSPSAVWLDSTSYRVASW